MNQKEFIDEIKKRLKIGYKEIGEAIYLSPDAVRMGAKRNALSELQIIQIKKVFVENKEDVKTSISDYGLDEIIEGLMEFSETELMNSTNWRLFMVSQYKSQLIIKIQKELEELKKNIGKTKNP